MEAHGGYSFCAAAALALLGYTANVDLKALLRWTVNRQMKYEGGFQGRTGKNHFTFIVLKLFIGNFFLFDFQENWLTDVILFGREDLSK